MEKSSTNESKATALLRQSLTSARSNFNTPIRVTFDSNVIEDVLGVKGHQDPRRHDLVYISTLAELIEKRIIMPCVSIEYFVIEYFSKNVRSVELMRPPNVVATTLDDECLSASISLLTSRGMHIHGVVLETLQKLRNVGGKIISCMRTGLPVCKEINVNSDLLDVDDIDSRDSLFYEVSDCIEKIGCGETYIRSRIGSCVGNGIFYDIDNSDLSLKEKAKYLGELADCDLIASHIAYRNDFLCTLDRGVGFGAHAIFKQENYMMLADLFCLKVVTPSILVERLRDEGYLDNDLS